VWESLFTPLVSTHRVAGPYTRQMERSTPHTIVSPELLKPNTPAQTWLRKRKRYTGGEGVVNIYVPGLCGLSLRVAATTNGATWHAGIVNTESRGVELASGEMIPASAIRRLCYRGEGTRIPFQEARSIILLLSMIGGMPHHQLLELAWEGMKPKDPPAPKRPLVVPISIRCLPSGRAGSSQSGSRPQASSPMADWCLRTIPTWYWWANNGAYRQGSGL
jgi:hypothetical protein